MIRVGVIGFGYWGNNVVRNFHMCPQSWLAAVADQRADRLAKLKLQFPSIHVTTDADDLLKDPTLDAVAIVTPADTHCELALRALAHGKHVWVEKPMASSSDEARRLIDEARRRRRVLMVDHTFVYNGAVRKVADLLRAGELGETYYYDSVRVNLGLFQHDVNVIWDLAVHDLAIIDYLFADKPVAVSATGMSHVPGGPENLAYLTLFFPGSLVAHVHVNWLAPVKLRTTLIGGDRKMIVYDDIEPSEKLKVYDKGISVTHGEDEIYQRRVNYRVGDMWAPQFDRTEALAVAVSHFLECIDHGKEPLTGGAAGLNVVRGLEAATLSMRRRGAPVEWTRGGGMA
jgi:predicted dehydrogenase